MTRRLRQIYWKRRRRLFREQSEIWLEQGQNRKRNPIGKNYVGTIQGALDKWILPVIGGVPLGSVDNLAVKPLVDKMCASRLSARTVNKYVEFVQQIVASLKGSNGESVHKRIWDAETMDLPAVERSEQKRPSLKADPISELIQESNSQEQALYVLLAATGMRVSEALALETRHFINNGRTIIVEQQVEKDAARIVQYLKTDAAKREVDLHPNIAEYLQTYMAVKTGLLFHTANGTPHLNGNLEDHWLTPRLIKKGLMCQPEIVDVFQTTLTTQPRLSESFEGVPAHSFLISRRPCLNCTRTFTRSCSCVSMKRSEWATGSFFPLRTKAQLYRLYRKCTKVVQQKK